MTYGGMATALPYPDRFYAGAAYAGLSATSPGNVDSLKSSSLGLSDDTILLLYGLYKQVYHLLLFCQEANFQEIVCHAGECCQVGFMLCV